MDRVIRQSHSFSDSQVKPPTAQAGYNSSYVLRLNDRLVWNLTGTEDTGAWLEKLAAIMELEAGAYAAAQTVQFTRRLAGGSWYVKPTGQPDLNMASSLSADGWRPRDLGVLCLWSRSGREGIVGELLDPGRHHMDVLMMSQCLHFVYDKGLDFDGVPFHAALVELEGKGVLLAGPGGRGKTTSCSRLPANWNVLCDDEALVLKDEFGRYVAHPFPTWKEHQSGWSERTWRVQDRVPLSAVFFLDRGEADSAIPVGTGEAANRINRSATQICFLSLEYLNDDEQRAWRKRIFHNSCRLAESLPAFVLRVSPTGPFWQEMESVLRTLRKS